jgi:nucleoside 2-deoxyribosyltransferase
MEITWEQVNRDIGKNCSAEYIVRRDKMQIDTCHILVAYIRVGPTFGTVMEIQYAHNRGIPVFVIDPNPDFKYASDAWCRAHTSKLFASIEECFDFIMSKNERLDN